MNYHPPDPVALSWLYEHDPLFSESARSQQLVLASGHASYSRGCGRGMPALGCSLGATLQVRPTTDFYTRRFYAICEDIFSNRLLVSIYGVVITCLSLLLTSPLCYVVDVVSRKLSRHRTGIAIAPSFTLFWFQLKGTAYRTVPLIRLSLVVVVMETAFTFIGLCLKTLRKRRRHRPIDEELIWLVDLRNSRALIGSCVALSNRSLG